MDVDIKEEHHEIEGYVIVDTTSRQNYSFIDNNSSCDSRSSKKRKLSQDHAKTSAANDEMLLLLQQWGLEVLHETFSKNLIDLSVLDYIVDVDIVDLCRDFPMRYRLILRHKLAEKRGKCVNGCSTADTSMPKAQDPRVVTRKPPSNSAVDKTPKREGLCPVDMVLSRPFSKRSDEEKRLLVSMNIPRPELPELKTSLLLTNKKTVIRRQFCRSRYDATWWLCGSQMHNKLYCWPCLLFHTTNENTTWHKKGMDDLHHLSSAIKSHSLSKKHIENIRAFENFGRPAAITGCASASDNEVALPTSTFKKREKLNQKQNHRTEGRVKVLPEKATPRQ